MELYVYELDNLHATDNAYKKQNINTKLNLLIDLLSSVNNVFLPGESHNLKPLLNQIPLFLGLLFWGFREDGIASQSNYITLRSQHKRTLL
jgi:hypothetical protein